MEEDKIIFENKGVSFIDEKVKSLSDFRRKLWDIVAPFGTVRSFGAFYFLVPIPNAVN